MENKWFFLDGTGGLGASCLEIIDKFICKLIFPVFATLVIGRILDVGGEIR